MFNIDVCRLDGTVTSPNLTLLEGESLRILFTSHRELKIKTEVLERKRKESVSAMCVSMQVMPSL